MVIPPKDAKNPVAARDGASLRGRNRIRPYPIVVVSGGPDFGAGTFDWRWPPNVLEDHGNGLGPVATGDDDSDRLERFRLQLGISHVASWVHVRLP